MLAAIAAGAIVAGLALGALVRLNTTSDSDSPIGARRTASPSMALASSNPSPSETAPSAQPPAEATQSPIDSAPPETREIRDLLPVKGSGLQVGSAILMAAGPDDGLYLAVPNGREEVVTLLDRNGAPRAGWPIVLRGSGDCNPLLAVPDGSVRILCYRPEAVDGLGGTIARAFAFDKYGDSLAGWPVDVLDAFTAATVGDDLALLSRPYQGDTAEENAPEYVRMDVVGADGAMRSGVDVAFPCCDSAFALGPEGMATLSAREWSESRDSVTTTLVAFDEAGIRDGWPVTIDGSASEVAFDPSGAVHLVVGPLYEPPSRTLVLSPEGDHLGESGDLDIISSPPQSAGEPYPAAPIVAADGSTLIVSTEDGTTIMGLDPGGQPRSGWPYRSKLDVESIDVCPGDTGCGSARTPIGMDGHDVLYLIHAASSQSAGGSVMAIGPDGRIRDGWPVGLRRAGSTFWAFAVNPGGGGYALAIEPEGADHSATIVAIAQDSTVRYTTTIVEP